MTNKKKYSRKFRLINEDGTTNNSGPGYIIINRYIIITNNRLYNKNKTYKKHNNKSIYKLFIEKLNNIIRYFKCINV